VRLVASSRSVSKVQDSAISQPSLVENDTDTSNMTIVVSRGNPESVRKVLKVVASFLEFSDMRKSFLHILKLAFQLHS